jgi:hypothetical protein
VCISLFSYMIVEKCFIVTYIYQFNKLKCYPIKQFEISFVEVPT